MALTFQFAKAFAAATQPPGAAAAASTTPEGPNPELTGGGGESPTATISDLDTLMGL